MGVFLELVTLEFAFEQLGGTAQAAQRVLDLVRQAAHHVARQGLLGNQSLLAADAQVAVDLLQLDDRQMTAVIVEDRRNRAIDRDLVSIGGENDTTLGYGRRRSRQRESGP